MRVCPACLAALLAVAATSCSRETPLPLHPVQGKLLFHNQPAAKAVVVLRPLGPALPKNLWPRGEVGPDGVFALGTYTANDGAPVGNYVLTVTWPEVKTDTTGDRVEHDRLQGRYNDATTSKWKVQIHEGNNQLETFQLH